jgi:hypothetical protein
MIKQPLFSNRNFRSLTNKSQTTGFRENFRTKFPDVPNQHCRADTESAAAINRGENQFNKKGLQNHFCRSL